MKPKMKLSIIAMIAVMTLLLLIPATRNYFIHILSAPSNGKMTQNVMDYEKYLGEWYSSDNARTYKDTFTQGGAILEIKEISADYIKGTSASIQLPPANRVAGIEFEGKLVNNQLIFNFTDSFLNTGTATLSVKPDCIEIVIDDFKLAVENSSGWQYGGGVFKIKN